MIAARRLMDGFTVLILCVLSAVPVRADRPAVTDHTTPAGIAFRHVTLPDEPRHAIAFGWRDGFALSRPGKEGLGILGPRLVYEGTAEHNRNAFSELLKDLGAATSFGGSLYYTVGSLTATPEKFGAAVALFADMLAKPAMSAERFAFLKKNAAATSRQANENAELLARHLMDRLTIGAGPLLNAISQPAEAFLGVAMEDVEAWRKVVLVRDRVIVASTGPMPPAAVAVEIDRLFAGLPLHQDELPPVPQPAMRASGKLIVLERPVAQTVVVASGPSGWTTGPDQLRADLAIQSMVGFEGRIFRALREQLGASYGVQAFLTHFHDNAKAISIAASVDSKKASDAIAAIRSEYSRLKADGLTDAEIAPLKTKQIASLDERFRQALQTAQLVRSVQFGHYPADYLEKYDTLVRSYDAAAINDGLRTKFPMPPLTFTVIAPFADGLGADCVIKSPAEISRCE